MNRLLAAFGASVCLIVPNLVATAQVPNRQSELKKLDGFVGTWNFEWDMKASVFGPAGKVLGVERFQWLPGNTYLQLNREGKGPAGEFRHTILFGYDSVAKRLMGEFFDLTQGGATSATYTSPNGKVWNWAGTGRTGTGTAYQERCTVTLGANNTSSTMTCEVSTDGKGWSLFLTSRATKST